MDDGASKNQIECKVQQKMMKNRNTATTKTQRSKQPQQQALVSLTNQHPSIPLTTTEDPPPVSPPIHTPFMTTTTTAAGTAAAKVNVDLSSSVSSSPSPSSLPSTVTIPIISDSQQLLEYGICRVPIPFTPDEQIYWSKLLSQVTPFNMTMEGDGEYAFYRNIMEEPNFPFERILNAGGGGDHYNNNNNNNNNDDKRSSSASSSNSNSVPPTVEENNQEEEDDDDQEQEEKKVQYDKNNNNNNDKDLFGNIDDSNNNNNNKSNEISHALFNYFGIHTLTTLQQQTETETEIQLDDAFCVHYNMNQNDTTGAKHTDPSDITINMCFEKSITTIGSHVLFYGRKSLLVRGGEEDGGEGKGGTKNEKDEEPTIQKFLVPQEPGYATIHWGDHPHETTVLESGQRTNIILTYCYTDPSRSNVSLRNCYG